MRLLSDPEATLIRLRHGDEGHWAGQIAASVTCIVDTSGKVKLAYVSDGTAHRPRPVALAKPACAINAGKEAPSVYPGKA